MTDVLLAVNAGSTSLKWAAFTVEADPSALARAEVSGLDDEAVLEVDGRPAPLERSVGDLGGAVELLPAWAAERADWRVVAVAHRIVHGGDLFVEPTRLDDTVLTRLEALNGFAPLHQPANLQGVRRLREAFPEAQHVGCFDTAFHATLPPEATVLPLPAAIRARGVRRYGFHGLSYQAVAEQLRRTRPELARGRVIAAHLGGGSSLCAMLDGVSVATTMGLTALDGVPMSTRSGAVDPGAVLHLVRTCGGADAVEDLLYHRSGLKGLSGLSGDVRVLLASDSPAAGLALAVYAQRVAEAAAGLTTALGGLDALVFTGGVGANAPDVRAAVERHLAHLRPFATLHFPTDEEAVMARGAVAVLIASP